MFEKRPIWGLIVGLYVCILIWLISVQEPVMFDASTTALSSSNEASEGEGISPTVAALVAQQNHNKVWSRNLLSKHLHNIDISTQSEVDKISVAASMTTLNFSNKNNHNRNNSSNINNSTAMLSQSLDVKVTTKSSELSSDIQTLTSSLGTGELDLKTKPTLAAVASALPDEDFNRLIDLQNFQFLMSQPICGHYIEALILIHSAPKNVEKRQVIRETWASISHHTAESPLRVLFLLGAVNSKQLQADLRNENNIYGDIIQGSFIDDYRNMTYKHIMAFKWFIYNCPWAQILIKVDDDVYVNTPQLIRYLKEQQKSQLNKMNNTNNDYPTIASLTTSNSSTTKSSSIFHKLNIFAPSTPSTTAETLLSSFNASQELFNHPQNLLFCQKIIGSLVKRSYRSKWRVSFKEYSERYYPPYCPGYAIIYSSDVIFRLYKAAQKSKYFWIDDVHITGVLAQQTNTTITTSSHYVLYSDECDQILTGKTDLNKTEFLFAWHSISAQKIKLLWHLQMISLQTLDDLHYKKKIMNDVNKLQHQRQQQQRRQQSRSADEYFSSSFNIYTSVNGLS